MKLDKKKERVQNEGGHGNKVEMLQTDDADIEDYM